MIRDKLAFAQDAFTFFKTSAVKSNQINQLMSSWFACKEGMWNGRLLSSFVHVLFYWTLWLNIYEKDWKGTWQIIAVFVQAISCLPLAAFPSSDWGLGWFFVEPASYSVAVWCKVRVFQNVVPQHYTTLWNPPIHSVSQLQHFVTSWDHDPQLIGLILLKPSTSHVTWWPHRLNDTNLKRLFVDCNLEEAKLGPLLGMGILWNPAKKGISSYGDHGCSMMFYGVFGFLDYTLTIIRTLNTSSSFHFVSYPYQEWDHLLKLPDQVDQVDQPDQPDHGSQVWHDRRHELDTPGIPWADVRSLGRCRCIGTSRALQRCTCFQYLAGTPQWLVMTCVIQQPIWTRSSAWESSNEFNFAGAVIWGWWVGLIPNTSDCWVGLGGASFLPEPNNQNGTGTLEPLNLGTLCWVSKMG